jgi:phosphatidylethanolamine/phosphatidyl-N-methylethanolamine N-methyltransferase
VKFLKEFIFQPAATGAIAPSSGFLARMIVKDVELDRAQAVLEYGPGTGVFTEFILRGLKPGAKFAAIELNPNLAEMFKSRFPRVVLFRDSVANVRSICDKAGMESVDLIISGLPWAVFPESIQSQFLDEMMRVLKPGGRFVTFAYLHGLALARAKKFSRLLPNYFTSVSKSPVVWLNLPPAFVYRCRR